MPRAIPDEITLATRIELGLADRTELFDLVDRRVAEATRIEGVLLELTTPLDMPQDDLSSRLEALSGVSKESAATMRVVVVDELVTRGALTIERAVAYLSVRTAPSLPAPLDAHCGALDDMLWMATDGTYGTLENVRHELSEIARACDALLEAPPTR